jgi:hypothetical protein
LAYGFSEAKEKKEDIRKEECGRALVQQAEEEDKAVQCLLPELQHEGIGKLDQILGRVKLALLSRIPKKL